MNLKDLVRYITEELDIDEEYAFVTEGNVLIYVQGVIYSYPVLVDGTVEYDGICEATANTEHHTRLLRKMANWKSKTLTKFFIAQRCHQLRQC